MIPATAHFIWYGDAFPWAHRLAIGSALARGGFERVVLHHDGRLKDQPHFVALLEDPRFSARSIGLGGLDAGLDRRLRALHDGLDSPTARANLVRALVLAREGGVYLDLDTITLATLAPLRVAGAFCGEEHLVFPARVVEARDPRALAATLPLLALRAACRALPWGWRLFQRVAHLYPRAVNNAVLGAEAKHPLMLAMLERMVAMPAARSRRRFALGTHLLQHCVREYTGRDLLVCPPQVFYPLGPSVSHHYFRGGDGRDARAIAVAETRVVHWYASVERAAWIARLDPEHVRAHAATELFSALCAPLLPELSPTPVARAA